MRHHFELDLSVTNAALPGGHLPAPASDVACDAVSGKKGADGVAHPGKGKGLDKKKDTVEEDTTSPPETPPASGPATVDTGSLVVGSDPDEFIFGGCGNDELYGGRGDDIVMGGRGNDFLSGNQGDDILVGGAGRDTFCFDGDFDTETVADFCVSDGDHMRFILYTPAQDALTGADLLGLFAQEGQDAVLSFADTNERVVLQGTDVDDLTEAMISVTIIPPAIDLIG